MELKIAHISYHKESTEEEDLKERRFIAGLARRGAKIKRLGKMCHTCAFKLNSEANLEPHNVAAAGNSLLTEGSFHCHIEKGVDKGCECIGFLHAKQYLNAIAGLKP